VSVSLQPYDKPPPPLTPCPLTPHLISALVLSGTVAAVDDPAVQGASYFEAVIEAVAAKTDTGAPFNVSTIDAVGTCMCVGLSLCASTCVCVGGGGAGTTASAYGRAVAPSTHG
jgi:hypothetical protein